ncbi:MAG: cupin domain-containing protein [Proteobacteria bacterium]|nr:cupin domain-containing protein [Pseudomonadota bacterium]MBI3496898.1 cupin domain-containing protein [Pseudomonadota bacterium]
MTTQAEKPDMADMSAQKPLAPESPAAGRARFFNSGNAFNVKLTPVPARSFHAEFEAASAPGRKARFFACDQSAELDCPFPATTPLMLARYAGIPAGKTLRSESIATGSIWYVIAGNGMSRSGQEAISWSVGDVFLLPGGQPGDHTAGSEHAVLWTVSNEPQLAFDRLRPTTGRNAPIEPVHYPAAEIARQIDLIYEASANEATSGIAVIFSSDRQEASRNIMPTLTLSLNSLPAATHQRAHRHNSAATTLIVKGKRCHSMVGAERCEWLEGATMVTPPGLPHSHHNAGDGRALFLIVQDGGLYYHARTMGFSFLE